MTHGLPWQVPAGGFLAHEAPFGDLHAEGMWTFEFRRPLRTKDGLRQDVQFATGR